MTRGAREWVYWPKMNKTLKTLLWAGAGAAALAAVNNVPFANADALSNELGGEGRFWPGPFGDVFYTRQGKGRPVVLLHGIYEGASGYEWRKNFDPLSEHFAVYAPTGWALDCRTSRALNIWAGSMWSNSRAFCGTWCANPPIWSRRLLRARMRFRPRTMPPI